MTLRSLDLETQWELLFGVRICQKQLYYREAPIYICEFGIKLR